MKKELLERRETMLRYMVKGLPLKTVIDKMTEDIESTIDKFKKQNTLRRDWANRNKWIDNIIRINDPSFLNELIAGMDEAMKQCWVEFADADNSNAKVGALRTIILGKTRVALLLMKAGVIKEAPKKIESTMTIAGTPFECDPEFRKLLVAESERQRLEKENAAATREPDSREE